MKGYKNNHTELWTIT